MSKIRSSLSNFKNKKTVLKWLIVSLLILFFPLGLYLTWKRSSWSLRTKKWTTAIVSGVVVLVVVLSVMFAPPSIKVTSSLSPLNASSYSLTGEVSQSGSIITVNDQPAMMNGERFSATLGLSEGDNRITIIAQNGSKKSQQEITIHRYTATEIAKQEQEAAAKKKQQEDSAAKQKADQEAADKKKAESEKVTYTLTAKADVMGQDTLNVSGNTNLPSGAALSVVIERIFAFSDESEERFYRVVTTNTTVQDGKYDIQVTVNDKKFLEMAQAYSQGSAGVTIKSLDKNVQVTVTFDPQANQPQAVVNAVGKSGEKLANSPQKDVFGSLTSQPVNHLAVTLKTPLGFPYTDQLPQ